MLPVCEKSQNRDKRDSPRPHEKRPAFTCYAKWLKEETDRRLYITFVNIYLTMNNQISFKKLFLRHIFH